MRRVLPTQSFRIRRRPAKSLPVPRQTRRPPPVPVTSAQIKKGAPTILSRIQTSLPKRLGSLRFLSGFRPETRRSPEPTGRRPLWWVGSPCARRDVPASCPHVPGRRAEARPSLEPRASLEPTEADRSLREPCRVAHDRAGGSPLPFPAAAGPVLR
jgi:hypothetical protein